MSKPWEKDWSTEDSNPGAKPWERELQVEESGEQTRQRRQSQASAMDYVRAIDSGVAQGVANIGAGLGTFIQDPAANTLAGVTGAAHLADRGITWALNKAGVKAEVNPELQEQARMTSRFAAEAREAQANDPMNLPARLGRFMEQDSRRVVEEIKANDRERNPELIRQQENMAQAEGFVDNLAAAVDNPLALTNTLARSAPDMAAGVGIGATLARGGVGIGRVSTAGTLAEAGSSAMQAREGVYQQVVGMPIETLAAQSPRFNQILSENGGDQVRAREALANELADQAPILSGVGTAAGSVVTNRLFGGDATAKSIMGTEAMTAKELAKRISQDTLEEGAQGVPEDAVQFGATVQADKSQEFDPGGALAQNIVAGFAMGSGGHGLAYARDNLSALKGGPTPNDPNQPQGTPGGQAQAPAGQATPPAGGDAAPAARVPAARGAGDAQAAGVASDSAEAAQRALREPLQLTALDRANELDAEQQRITQRLAEISPENGYGPMFDAERTELQQQAQAFKAERDEIAKTWPAAIQGAPTTFSTEAGARLDGQYALIDADDLVTSHDENLRPNALFPAELQPRDRSRQASEMQVSGIVQRLDPARLGVSADAATGAPIVGADGLVESGNARTIALKRVYQANGQKAEDYKAWLRQSASQFGIAPEAIEGMRKPVLVRVRQTPVNRAEFARQANQATVQRMSTSEQAKSDASRLTSLEGLEADEQGDFSSSRDFIRQFMATLPITEQSEMIESDGRLSTSGYRRIQNAVLAKAYGDSPTLRRMTESLDSNVVNVGKALVRAAPTIAQARDRMQAGVLNDADITPDLLAAVEGLSSIKEKGWTVEQELAQGDLSGPKYSPEAMELLQFLSDNIRSPRRIAEFLQRYHEALEAAGDPNQGSLLGDTQAPTRAELLNQAKGGINEQVQDGAADPQAGPVDRKEPQNAPRSESSARRNEGRQADAQAGQQGAEGSQSSEWVMFPPASGTLGIPRAQMPQVKVNERPALIAFLKSRGIEYERATVPAADLKPTQAEFSPAKVEGWIKSDTKGDRSVLVSADGYVLDGHHQWMGSVAGNEPAQVLRFDAPIKELLAVVRAFPGVKQSPGAGDDLASQRAAAVRDFKDALSDLAAIATKHTRAAMVPEKTPDLVPALAKLFDSAIRLVGTDLKATTKWVKDQLKADPRFKTFWNKIAPETYRKAALMALENPSKPAQGSLFDDAAEASSAVQSDLFGAAMELAEPVVKVAKINGREYDMQRDNFKPPPTDTFIPEQVLTNAREMIGRLLKVSAPVEISPADRERAEALLKPLLKRAQDVKAEYDQKIIDIATRTGALGQMLAPVKGLKRAVEKLATDRDVAFDTGKMYDLLRSTIVVRSYGDAQAVVDAIREEFEILPGRIKDQSDAGIVAPEVKGRAGFLPSGYGQVLVNARMPNGVIAEIQINVPEMLAVKMAEGHQLYEIERAEEPGSKTQADAIAAQKEIYPLAKDASALRAAAKNSASDILDQRKGHQSVGEKDPDFSLSTKRLPSGNSTYDNSTPSSSVKSMPNLQPGGKEAGTSIDKPRTRTVPQSAVNGYNPPDLFGDRDATAQPGQGLDEGQGAGAAQGNGGQGDADGVRARGGRGNQQQRGDDDAGTARTREVGQARADGERQADQSRGPDAPGAGAGPVGGIPAGRDIAPKSGLNYVFGDGDLTYTGSWFAKAQENLRAVEILKQLQKDGRQATREEQAALAKFTGWGSSEMANNLFGEKLTSAAAIKAAGEKALAAMDKAGKDSLRAGGYQMVGYRNQYVSGDTEYMDAFKALQLADPKITYYTHKEITRDMIKAVMPDRQTQRWMELRDRLKELLTPEEYADASRSTQYAHYTSKAVVSSMWKAAERMGFAGGTILEPGAGIGVFPGLMPQGVAASSSYTGIEFEPITGGILKQLFPDERILVESFVDSKLPKNFFDIAIGNPPFSGTKILGDPEYAKQALALHDYFFAKTIDRVKPGGLVMFVTSRFTMDKLGDKARKYMAERADLVGAIRLPQTAFKANAGTEVVTDVLFLRKKVPGQTFDQAQAWTKVVEAKTADGKTLMVSGNKTTDPDQPAMINEYFAAHPEMVLGEHSAEGSMRRAREYTVKPLAGDIEAHFAKAVENLPADIYTAGRGSAAEAAKVREIDFNPKAKKEGNYYVTDAGVLMIREEGVGQRVELRSPKDVELIKDFVPLRDALKQAHYDQLTDGDWETSLKALQAVYKKFTAKHGQINQFTTKVVKTKEVDEDTGETFTDESTVRVYPLLQKLRDDPDYSLVAALETINDDTGEIKPSDFLTGRVLGKPETASINSPADALLTVLNDVGRVDVDLIAQRLGMSVADAVDALGSTIYQDPEAGWQTADEYLSGNVRAKLDAARAAAQADRRFERNVSALEAAQPAPKTPSQIAPGLGENWIPGQDYADFLRELAGVKAEVSFNDATKQWIVKEISGGKSAAATADHGTDQRNATEILEHALTGRPIRITKTVGTGKDRATVFDAPGTEAANQKLDQMREAFAAWIWKDPDRTDRLVRIYNDRFNTTVNRKFDGSHLTLPGTSKAFQVFDHVKRGAWRIIQRGNTYLAHAVGSGKTFQMVIAAMEQKRLGLIKKPMVVVPNHMLKQFAHEWQLLYPAARLMVADENNFHTDNRRRFVSRVALSDLDGVVITHSAFKLLDLDPEFKAKMIEEQLDFMRAALEEAEQEDKSDGNGRKSPRVKQIEKQIENMEQKLEAATSGAGKDKNVRFDELGVDFLMVDEAHEYRKLDFTTTRQVKGLSPQGSAKSFDLYMKSRYLEEKKPGRSLVMASGTVVTNTLAELYTVQKFMDRQALIDRNIDDFDSWASMFGRERTTLEPDAAGRYTPVTRFTKFVKVPALTQMFREFADVLTSDHLAALLGDKRPKVEGGSRVITVTPKTDAYASYQKELERRVEASRAWKPSKEEPNNPDPMIRIIGDGRLAAIDMRFINPSLPSDPDSKLNRMVDDVIAKFKETANLEYRDKAGNVEPNKGAAMMVFSDLGFGAGVAANRGFNARAWFEKRMRDEGIPMNQVAFMSDYKKSADKLKLFKDVNAGRVRVLVGSSKNMGTGVNAQQRLKALFHLDSPWYPADLEQREGRIIRQGNKNPKVEIYAYAAKGTYDENMWKMLASKQYFIDQAMSGDENLNELEDLDSQSQYDLAAAMVAEDPRILQLAGARAEIEKLQRLYQAHEDQRQRFRSQFDVASTTAEFNEKKLPEAEKAAAKAQDLSGDKFTAKVGGKAFTERAKWAEALVGKFDALTTAGETKPQTIGEISGFPIVYGGETVGGQFVTRLVMGTPSPVFLHESFDQKPNLAGLAMRAQNAVADVARMPGKMRERITEARAQMDAIRERLSAPFPMAGMLADKVKEAQAIEDAIKSDSTDKTYRVERKADGLGFDVKAVNESSAIMKAIETNGGAPEDWIARMEQPAAPAEGETRLSLRERNGDTDRIDFKALQGLAQRLKARMPNMPTVRVLEDPAKAPRALREYIIRQDAWHDVEGAMHDGELYLFASGLASAERAEHVLLEHEAGHYGLRAILGPSLKTAMRLVYIQNAKVRKAAAELQKRGKLSDAVATEEVIVDIPTADLARLKGWRKVVMTARDWLAQRGYSTLAQKLTDWLDGTLTQQQRADLFVAELVGAARDYVAGRRPGRASVGMGTRLSGTLAEDIAKQEAWLQREAQARGFKDIEDLLARDYPLFEKLAELWRKKNPAEVLLSRSPTTAAAYEARIDALFAGEKPAAKGVRVLDRSDMLDMLGFGDGPVYLVEAKVAKGATNHPHMNSAAWKKVPQWLDNPAAVFDSDTQPGRLVFIAPELVNGSPVRIIIDPRPGGDGVNLLINAYDAERNPFQRWEKDGLLRYFDRKKATPVTGSFQPRLTGLPGEQGRSRILTEKNLAGYLKSKGTALSRATLSATKKTAAERADEVIKKPAGGFAPLDRIARLATKATGFERLTGAIYNRAGALLDRLTPEKVKAGIVSDYGVPEAVIDQRIMLQGRQRVQLRKVGTLVEKLATLTREESRVAYEWMNMDGSDPKAYLSKMQGLPEESVAVLQEVQKMIDDLSKEAVRLGQLPKDAFERNRFAYLRRSYAKHILEQTAGDKAKRARVISILGDQYKGRGLVQAEPMAKMQAAAPDWWGRKLVGGKADTALKGQKFIRLEKRATPGQANRALPGMAPAGPGRVERVVYWPADQRITGEFTGWTQADTWEVRDVKGGNVVLWRDFTKAEREQMGEIDEARFAIAKTLHGMVHDVEVGRYLEWLARNYSRAEGQTIPGTVVEASERYRDTFAPSEWVKVPDTTIPGTSTKKYGALAGHYLPGPIWNDLRQVVGGQFRPFGDTYATILRWWKTSKTALSPGVHMNNIMSNMVMADWQDVTAAHVAKSLRIILASTSKNGGITDREAAQEIVNRYKDSGGDIGSWATQEISREQLDPLLAELDLEMAATNGQALDAQAGIFAALQHALGARFPAAWEALKAGKTGKAAAGAGGALIDLYQAEDDVFRLAAWLKSKEEGADDLSAGKKARRSFLDYNINAPWVQAMRNSAWPFISFTYRAVPLLAEIAGKKPHKLMKLMAFAGGLNALGALLAGGEDDEERRMLPEEKAGSIWGMVPKLIRMPWNDEHGSPVFLDIRRWVPVGDVFDVGAGNAAVPMFPGLMPGGPLVLAGEVVLNKSAFTGKPITLETDTGAEKAEKLGGYLYKAFAPNIVGLPGTYAAEGVVGSMTGRTDAFGRELSTPQALASSFGVKLGSYPADVLRRNLSAKAMAELSEIDKQLSQLKRQYSTGRIDMDELREQAADLNAKKVKIAGDLREKIQ